MPLSQRQPRVEDPAYLAYVRTLPCLVCGAPGRSDPAHIRSASRQYGKRLTGMAEKPDDKWVLPLCRTHHDDQHRHAELQWWARHGIDPFAAAVALYASRPGAANPPREKRRQIVKTFTRKPKGERRAVPKGKPLESASNWPPKGTRKIPTRAKEHA